MDNAQEENYDGAAEEESDQYSWLAGAFVGGFLILMIVIIIGIIIWKHVKNQNTSIDQNWAGPSPLADGNIREVGNCMNSSILGRSMSLSHISLSPIVSNEQEVPETGGEMQQGQEEEANGKKVTAISAINIPTISAASTKNKSLASEVKMSSQTIGLYYETFPPPPLDLPQEFPLPPPPGEFPEQELKDNPLQPFPERNSYQQDENGTQEPLNLQISDMDHPNIANKLEDHLLPPPPPDF